ncbi:hypothetical protein F4801DRAFT_574140 [Xylaria longipes]|nr:hypothetical protein F4801DRAFT_574140 [Xylaria longipes]RYC62795.1 hypothetical protein CHU98_g3400 [Xylaria longipes]
MIDQCVVDLYKKAHSKAVQSGKEKALHANLIQAVNKVSGSEAVTYDVKSIQYGILHFAAVRTFDSSMIATVPLKERSSMFAPQFNLGIIQQAARDTTLDITAFIQTITNNGVSYSKMPQSATSLAANTMSRPQPAQRAIVLPPAPTSAVALKAAAALQKAAEPSAVAPKPKAAPTPMRPPRNRASCGRWEVLIPGQMGPMDYLLRYQPVLSDLVGCNLSILTTPNRIRVGETIMQYSDRPAEIAEALRHTVRISAVVTLEEYTSTAIRTGVSENIVDWVLKRHKSFVDTNRNEIEYFQSTVDSEDVEGKKLQILEASDVAKRLAASRYYTHKC